MAATTTTNDAFDIVIIGAGVAGALIAEALSRQDVRMLLLEAGEGGASRGEFALRYAGATVKSLSAPFASADAKLPGGPELPSSAPSRAEIRDAYYDQSGNAERYLSTYERRVGGSTWHWLGHTPRLLPNDFRMKTAYNVAVDWPISYADLEPFYCKAETELGVAGDDAEWKDVHGAFRSQAFPMSKIWASWSDELFARALQGRPIEGRDIAVLSTPSARNTRAYDGRPPCAGNASCVPICPIGAKYDASVHLKRALARSCVELREKCVVTALEAEADGTIHRVRYRQWDLAEKAVAGRIVILAANAIESAKVLLLSGDGGLANSSGQVGCNLMDHVQKAVLATAQQPLYPFRGPPSTSGVETFRDGPTRSRRAAFRMSLGNDGWSRIGAPQTTAQKLIEEQRLYGDALRRALFDQVSRQARMSCSVEVLPNKQNRVELSHDLDPLGLRRPRLTFSTDDYTRAAFGEALDVIDEILRAIDATPTSVDRNPQNYTGAGHIMGTTRMGFDKKMSVVDADCRSHDHPTLFIVGASNFPTGGTANPTLTIAALALRAAEHILQILPKTPSL
jgi:choline dehydrogenase-like flavoprotein